MHFRDGPQAAVFLSAAGLHKDQCTVSGLEEGYLNKDKVLACDGTGAFLCLYNCSTSDFTSVSGSKLQSMCKQLEHELSLKFTMSFCK